MEHTDLIIFDLDDTLTESKSPIDTDMADLVCQLLHKYNVAVITGGTFTQLDKQFVSHLSCKDMFSKLYLLPTSGAMFYKWQDDSWVRQYAYTLSHDEVTKIMTSLQKICDEYDGTYFNNVSFEDQVENRETQITFSALGQHARIEDKEVWDPDRSKRAAIQKKLLSLLPKFEIRIGGTTSIDITKPGIDKGYGLEKFFGTTNFTKENAIFVGDALFKGGNDYAAKEIGLKSISVEAEGLDDTKEQIRKLLT